MQFRPVRDRIIVKRIDAGEKTSRGIITPTMLKRSRNRARSSRPGRRQRIFQRSNERSSRSNENECEGGQIFYGCP
jgi:co-chaperonin GroES (HSP10)